VKIGKKRKQAEHPQESGVFENIELKIVPKLSKKAVKKEESKNMKRQNLEGF
jgi:hypothetical protein